MSTVNNAFDPYLPPLASSERRGIVTRCAVVIDQWALFRLGVEQILGGLDIRVLASTGQAGNTSRIVRDEGADLIIVGKSPNLNAKKLIREIKRINNEALIIGLLDRAAESDVAALLSAGADALLLRSCSPQELSTAIIDAEHGDRTVQATIATASIGRIGPTIDLDPDQAVAKSGLSPKELEVLGVLAEGLTYDEIAASMVIGKATVKTHLVHIYSKLGVRNREQAVARALSLGLLS